MNIEFEEMNAIEMFFLYLESEEFLPLLMSYAERNGYSISEIIVSAFAEEYDKWEEGYFGDYGIKFEIEPPAADVRHFKVMHIPELKLFLKDLLTSNFSKNTENYFLMQELIEKI